MKVQFSSECKVRVFANCSKNQNKVLKCIFKSSWVLGFAKYWGLCKKKIPHGWGNTGTLKCTISKVPTSARGPPPPRGGRWQVHYAVLCGLNRKIVQFFWLKRKLQRYVPLNSVIPNFVAFIVVLLRWYCLVFLFFFSPFFRRNVRFPPKKIFSLAIPGAIVFHIRSNYGIWADNRDLVNQSER